MRSVLSAAAALALGAGAGAGTINVPEDFPTIQEAIDAAVDGDDIAVAAGTYAETIDLSGKAIVVRSADGPALTAIDGQGTGTVVTAATGEGPDTLLAGFTITGGAATGGGGGMLVQGASPGVVDCIFSGNTADLGGGLHVADGGPTVVNCAFLANSAAAAGGGVYNGGLAGSDPVIVNCTFFDNAAPLGGALFNQSSAPTILGSTISGNAATLLGGGLYSDASTPTVANSIIWGNDLDQIFSIASNSTITFSNVQGGTPGVGNINQDPRFVDAAAGDLRLDRFSPCVDAGDTDLLPADEFDLDGDGDVVEPLPVDLAGNPRTFDDAGVDDTGAASDGGPVVDMGALERQEESVPIVFMVGPGESIQAAIESAGDGDEIEVAAGTYPEAINFGGKAIVVRSAAGAGATTIDATGLGTSAVTCANGEGPDTVLEGFTITGGSGTFDGTRLVGGGMNNLLSDPTVVDCVFSANSAGLGGGMYNLLSNPTVTGCTFSGNAAGVGGGMYNSSSTPGVDGCTFAGNSAGAGGGLANEFSGPAITASVFNGNEASPGGGAGVFNGVFSNAKLVGCTFQGNAAPDWLGGGLLSIQSMLTIQNCTFSDNTALQGAGATLDGGAVTVFGSAFSGNEATDFGGGIAAASTATVTVVNTTFAGNLAPAGSAVTLEGAVAELNNCIVWDDTLEADAGSTITATYSDIQGGFAGTGNIDADPLFADPAGGDLRPSAGSPAIDAADNDAVPADTQDLDGDGDTAEPAPLDLDGNARFVDDPDTPDSGNGEPPLVDMGAYEFQGVAPCPADLDGDGAVGTTDFLELLAAWGTDPGGPPDLDGDGTVGTTDFLELLAAWGPCP